MTEFQKSVDGFSAPTAAPTNEVEAGRWQQENRSWWEQHPMRYDWNSGIEVPEFSPEFYRTIDQRFFSALRPFLPWRNVPFDSLIDYSRLVSQDVLEIGVGNGTHAEVLAPRAKSYTGIDLTEYATHSTRKRFELFDIKGRILRMDAEKLEFADESFDLIWTWGVIHHSSNTEQVLSEMRRVLRPGGRAITMVYHRGWWNYYLVHGLLLGVASGRLWRTRSLHQAVQDHTDGAIARYYSRSDWRDLTSRFFRPLLVQVMGPKTDVLALPRGRVKDAALRAVPDALTRFLTNRCGFGGFVVSVLERK